ncbi:MAG: hypothetical protein PUI24_07835, partial [Spirochaetales bacterium]|nr:hypothetical protein [Spirochaetales bacterium]
MKFNNLSIKNLKRSFSLLALSLIYLASCKNNLITEKAYEKSTNGNCQVNMTLTNGISERTLLPTEDMRMNKIPQFGSEGLTFSITFKSKTNAEVFEFTEMTFEEDRYSQTYTVPCGFYDVTIKGYSIYGQNNELIPVETLLFYGSQKNVILREKTKDLLIPVDYNTTPVIMYVDEINEGYFSLDVKISAEELRKFSVETDENNIVNSGLVAILESVDTGEELYFALEAPTSTEEVSTYKINSSSQMIKTDSDTFESTTEITAIKPGYYRLSIKGPDPDRQTTMKALLSEDLILIGTSLNTTGTIEVKGAVSADVTYYASDSRSASGDGSTEAS